MAVTTIAPNGDSKNLYAQSVDTKILQTVCFALEEKDLDKIDSVPGNTNGTNTIVDSNEIGEIDYQNIERVGYVGIILQPSTPELKQAMMKKSEKAIAQRKAELENNETEKTDDSNR
jgi:hypothetical protein